MLQCIAAWCTRQLNCCRWRLATTVQLSSAEAMLQPCCSVLQRDCLATTVQLSSLHSSSHVAAMLQCITAWFSSDNTSTVVARQQQPCCRVLQRDAMLSSDVSSTVVARQQQPCWSHVAVYCNVMRDCLATTVQLSSLDNITTVPTHEGALHSQSRQKSRYLPVINLPEIPRDTCTWNPRWNPVRNPDIREYRDFSRDFTWDFSSGPFFTWNFL